MATTTFGEQILCFKSKLLCPTHCVEGRSNKEHLKGQNKSVTTNQPEEVFKFVTTRVSEFSGWERLAECKIDFLIVSLKLLFYSDHINNFRWTLIPTKNNSFDRVFCLATLFADNFIISNKCTWAFHCSFFTNYTTTPIRIQIRQQQYAWLKTHCIPL